VFTHRLRIPNATTPGIPARTIQWNTTLASIEQITEIRAPIERCFDLARSIDLHLASTEATGERAVGGVTAGPIGLGQQVRWRARHFGIVFEMTSLITEMERPRYFQDRMVAGPFSSFEHDHTFEAVGESTRMRDVLRFEAPLGPVGRLVSRAFLRPHLERFLAERNSYLKTVAESVDEWQRFARP
jgi:ligand-binding SRPBCC domain-containing protein